MSRRGTAVVTWQALPVTTTHADIAVLDQGERERTSAFARPELRARFAGAHALVRRVLGRELGVPPEAVKIGARPCARCGEPHGKPEVAAGAGRRLSFSLAHSGELAAVAVGRGVEVGLDLEVVRPLPALEHAVAPLVGGGGQLPSGSRGWLREWVRREAYLKGTGDGIASEAAAALRLPPAREERPGAWSEAPSGWWLLDLALAPGVVTVLAAVPRPQQVIIEET